MGVQAWNEAADEGALVEAWLDGKITTEQLLLAMKYVK